MVAASFENVFKTYKIGLFGSAGIPAVRGVSLAIPSGSAFALLGPNRAGKTTLVKMLLSLCAPTTGTIARFGLPIDRRSTRSHPLSPYTGPPRECRAER